MTRTWARRAIHRFSRLTCWCSSVGRALCHWFDSGHQHRASSDAARCANTLCGKYRMTNIEAAAWKIDDTLVGRHDKCTRPVKAGMWPQTALQINGSGEVETHRRGSVRPASMLATEGATLIRRIRKSARALSVANNQNFISWRKARANKNQRAQQRKLRPKGSVTQGFNVGIAVAASAATLPVASHRAMPENR